MNGDAERLVETLLSRRDISDWNVEDVVTSGLCDISLFTDVSIVFFRAISSSNYGNA